jgi:hypothetical protein
MSPFPQHTSAAHGRGVQRFDIAICDIIVDAIELLMPPPPAEEPPREPFGFRRVKKN